MASVQSDHYVRGMTQREKWVGVTDSAAKTASADSALRRGRRGADSIDGSAPVVVRKRWQAVPFARVMGSLPVDA